MTDNWRHETDSDGIVWLCLDKADSNANVLSRVVMEEFEKILRPLEENPPRGIVIFSAKASGFIMGADINDFPGVESPEQAYELVRLGQSLMDRVEALRCPVVAAINGFALGGGLELAMACHYRLALQHKKPIIGLPEVQLGLHPGFGGTVRLVRIAGVRAAMPIMLTGKPITADKALRQGLIDRIAAPDNWKQAAKELISSRRPRAAAPLTDRILNLPFVRPFIARTLRKQVAAKARQDHYPAPYAIVDLWARHGASQRSGYKAEARSFAELMCTGTSRNLVRVFFLQNRLKSQGGKPAKRIERVHVVGAGVMGGDIAAWCALRGLQVTLQDREERYIEPAIARAAKLFSKRIRDANDRARASDRLIADVDGAGVAAADLVIEAIFEDLDAKQALYGRLEAGMKADAILATNTSSIRLEDLRTVLSQPQRFVGLHFFNPVAMLPLVEVVHCEDTEQQVVDFGLAFVKGIGKSPLECLSSPGFVVNRVLAPYMAEAMYLAADGVPLLAIDRAAEDFGMPMGPVELADSVGIDIAIHVAGILGDRFDPAGLERMRQMVEAGRLGRKSGQGFYEWRDGKVVKPEAVADAEVPRNIQDRLMLPMINEAVATLAEGVVSDADLLDAGVIFGTGFAPFRGGPLHYASERGTADVVLALQRLQEQCGDRFRPHDGWSAIRDSAN